MPKDNNCVGEDGPVDVVFTWVDSSDPSWISQKCKYDDSNRLKTFDSRRYGDGKITNIEIETSVLSVLKYAPWVDTIWIATSGQIPSFLENLKLCWRRKIKVVFHKDFFVRTEILPTFNSHTIEANLFNIEGLSDRFIYMNDDMIFTSPVQKYHFFKEGIPCYRPILVANVKIPPVRWFLSKINPSSDIYLSCTSNLSPYGSMGAIWRYSHHAVPLLKSYFYDNVSKLGAVHPLCGSRFRCKNDIPPIHAAVLEAYKNKKCRIFRGKYISKYMESFRYEDLNCFHEICVNNVDSLEMAKCMHKCIILGVSKPRCLSIYQKQTPKL